MCCCKNWLTVGALMAMLAVVTGAFGAHGLEGVLNDLYSGTKAKTIGGMEVPATYKYLQDFKTAAEYQIYHAFGLMIVGLLSMHYKKRSLQIAAWSFIVGIILFSGCLYLLVLINQPKLGMIVPIGGVAFIIGWIALAIGGMSCHLPTSNSIASCSTTDR